MMDTLQMEMDILSRDSSLTLLDQSIYERVYDITEGYMLRLHQRPLFSKKVFLLSVGHPSNQVDMSSWSMLDDEEFICACFILLLGRELNVEKLAFWLNQENPREKIMDMILMDRGFLNRGVRIRNWPPRSSPFAYRFKFFLRRLYSFLYNKVLYRVYSRLPSGLKVCIRRVLHLFSHLKIREVS